MSKRKFINTKIKTISSKKFERIISENDPSTDTGVESLKLGKNIYTKSKTTGSIIKKGSKTAINRISSISKFIFKNGLSSSSSYIIIGFLIFLLLFSLLSSNQYLNTVIANTDSIDILDNTLYTSAEIEDILQNIDTTNLTRESVIKVALSLVGKVDYFWGGKSSARWNDEWGTIKLVTVSGSKSSGTYKPYGLDCSGFTSWVYLTAGYEKNIGITTKEQIKNSYAISENDLLPGDLVFKNISGSEINHVGIFYKRENSKNYYIHCSSNSGVVVNNYSGFRYFRRLKIKYKDD
jgi:cell wall-associated NlpC family hydrolase